MRFAGQGGTEAPGKHARAHSARELCRFDVPYGGNGASARVRREGGRKIMADGVSDKRVCTSTA